MRAEFATESTPGRPNDDYAAIGPDWAVVLDGATALRPDGNGCVHDVPWFVRRLAGGLIAALTSDESIALADAVSLAIQSAMAAHESTCDLSNPDSPSATVTLARWRSGTLDYLVLADSPLLIERGTEVQAVVDDRMAHLDDYSYDAVMRVQNTPEGYYVASTLPDAAYQAVCDSVSLAEVTGLALLSDGASRLADLYRYLDWRGVMDVLRDSGPAALIARTRAVELSGARVDDGRTRKDHDDATAVLVRPRVSHAPRGRFAFAGFRYRRHSAT